MRPITEINDPALATDAADLLRRCDRATEARDSAEFNFPAAILQALDFARNGFPLDLDGLERSAEEGMLQVAFFNEGYAAPSPWIIKAYEAGWRYRIGAGFTRTTEATR